MFIFFYAWNNETNWYEDNFGNLCYKENKQNFVTNVLI